VAGVECCSSENPGLLLIHGEQGILVIKQGFLVKRRLILHDFRTQTLQLKFTWDSQVECSELADLSQDHVRVL